MSISVVYIVGNGSKWDDNELRFSLRSIDKHLGGIGEVFIIGNKPWWIKNVHHIQADDRHKNKDRNIMLKTLVACYIPEITDEFLCFHDDVFLNEKYYATTFPYFHDGLLSELLDKRMKHPLQRNGLYNHTIDNTIQALSLEGANINNYDTHTPIRYDKRIFIDIMNKFDFSVEHGLLVKSIYANMSPIIGKRQEDVKINEEMPYKELHDLIFRSKIFSIGDRALTPDSKFYLENLYNKPSRWEI